MSLPGTATAALELGLIENSGRETNGEYFVAERIHNVAIALKSSNEIAFSHDSATCIKPAIEGYGLPGFTLARLSGSPIRFSET